MRPVLQPLHHTWRRRFRRGGGHGRSAAREGDEPRQAHRPGRRPGLHRPPAHRGRPPTRQLAGIAGIQLRPGQGGYVTVRIDRRSVSYVDEGRDAWVTSKGRMPVDVGTSADDTRFAGWLSVR
ncbi:fibronectin type III-like domain-contianing protein [Streptomyces sp. NPDC046909]|uniref:fibronectin type III-like domain-contianing protein n=1 Tax=Streptomyces sp. NPDC046909 TaxID=3155617 RepID=UPI0033E76978